MKQYRFEHQLKQADIAKKLGISQQVYSLIENGTQQAKIVFLLRYKKITGVELTETVLIPSDVPTMTLDELADPVNPVHTIRALKAENRILQEKISALEKKLKKG